MNHALINSGLPTWIIQDSGNHYNLSAHVTIPCIINAVSGLLFLIKQTQKTLREFMGSSEAMGWAARGRRDKMPYNLGNHYNLLVAIPCIINAVSIAFRMVH